MNPKILILSASVGAGHVRAAQAVELALRELCPGATVQNVDLLSLSNRPFRRIYGKGYFQVAAAAPHLVGYMYDKLDRPASRTPLKLDWLRIALQNLCLRRLKRLLVEEPWDLVISTHFLPAEMIAALRRSGRVDYPHVTVCTDFDVHLLWVNEPCEHYFTATEEGRQNIAPFVSPDKITATGIPIHPVYREFKEPAMCRARLGIGMDRPVIVQLSGGMGVGPISRIHQGILDVQIPLQVIAAAGRNEAARTQLESIPYPARHQRQILGMSDRIDELIGAADLIVSKPGGLTTSEALARGTAMVIVDPIPGQESRNSDFLLENGAAIKINNLASLSYKLTSILAETGRIQKMRAAAARLGRPRAAHAVAAKALEFVCATSAKPQATGEIATREAAAQPVGAFSRIS